MTAKNPSLLDVKIGEDAFSIEQVYFTKTNKRVNPKNQSPFKFWPGNLPILVSAPHAVRHERKKKVKVSEEFTGSLAFLLNRIAGCHALATTKLYGGDPNYDYPCIYKDFLREVCQNNRISLIIDLHGAARDHDFDIDIGTMKGEAVLGKEKILQTFENSFIQFGLTNISKDYFPGVIQNTVIKFAVKELGIPAIQLEVNRRFRVPHQNPEAYTRLLSALVYIIEYLIKKRII